MVESIYLAATEAASGKSAVALALLEHLGRRVGRVLPFRPIVPAVGEDALLDVLRARLGPESPPTEDLCGVSYEEVHADLDAAMSDIVDRFHAVADRCDLVLVIGSDFSDIATPTEFSVNARIAANLGAPVLLVLGGQHQQRQAEQAQQDAQQRVARLAGAVAEEALEAEGHRGRGRMRGTEVWRGPAWKV